MKTRVEECPLLSAKKTLMAQTSISANNPKQTSFVLMDSESVHPDAAAVQKRAQARTGLLDFSVPPLEVPLSVLMRSLAEEASLHSSGSLFGQRPHRTGFTEANYAMHQSSAMTCWKIAIGKSGRTSTTARPLIGVLEVTSSFRGVFPPQP